MTVPKYVTHNYYHIILLLNFKNAIVGTMIGYGLASSLQFNPTIRYAYNGDTPFVCKPFRAHSLNCKVLYSAHKNTMGCAVKW